MSKLRGDGLFVTIPLLNVKKEIFNNSREPSLGSKVPTHAPPVPALYTYLCAMETCQHRGKLSVHPAREGA